MNPWHYKVAFLLFLVLWVFCLWWVSGAVGYLMRPEEGIMSSWTGVRWLWTTMYMLGAKFFSSKIINALNYKAIATAQTTCLKYIFIIFIISLSLCVCIFMWYVCLRAYRYSRATICVWRSKVLFLEVNSLISHLTYSESNSKSTSSYQAFVASAFTCWVIYRSRSYTS